MLSETPHERLHNEAKWNYYQKLCLTNAETTKSRLLADSKKITEASEMLLKETQLGRLQEGLETVLGQQAGYISRKGTPQANSS
jgi:hypothetical protein